MWSRQIVFLHVRIHDMPAASSPKYIRQKGTRTFAPAATGADSLFFQENLTICQVWLPSLAFREVG